MIPDLDIYRTAKLLVKRHGCEAILHAATRADELLAADDIVEQATWLRVLEAVKKLLATKPAIGVSIH